MDDGCLDMTKAFHVGCRGSVSCLDVLVEDKEQGWTTIDMDMFVDIGPVEAARRVMEQIGECRLHHFYLGKIVQATLPPSSAWTWTCWSPGSVPVSAS